MPRIIPNAGNGTIQKTDKFPTLMILYFNEEQQTINKPVSTQLKTSAYHVREPQLFKWGWGKGWRVKVGMEAVIVENPASQR